MCDRYIPENTSAVHRSKRNDIDKIGAHGVTSKRQQVGINTRAVYVHNTTTPFTLLLLVIFGFQFRGVFLKVEMRNIYHTKHRK